MRVAKGLPGRHKSIELFGEIYVDIVTALRVRGFSPTDAVLSKSQDPYNTIKQRLRAKLTPLQAFGYEPPPIRNNGGRRRKISVDDVLYSSVSDALEKLSDNINYLRLTGNVNRLVALVGRRIDVYGWTNKQALGLDPSPPKANKSLPHKVVCGGMEYPSKKALANAFDVPLKIVYQRLSRDGFSPEAAVENEPPTRSQKRFTGRTGDVYCVTCTVTKKSYVGITLNRDRRWRNHVANSSIDSKEGTLEHDIYLYDEESFYITFLEEDTPAELLQQLERNYIKELNTLAPNGYNQNRGGVLGSCGEPINLDDGRTFYGVYHASEMLGIPAKTIYQRKWRGLSNEQMLAVDGPSSRY